LNGQQARLPLERYAAIQCSIDIQNDPQQQAGTAPPLASCSATCCQVGEVPAATTCSQFWSMGAKLQQTLGSLAGGSVAGCGTSPLRHALWPVLAAAELECVGAACEGACCSPTPSVSITSTTSSSLSSERSSASESWPSSSSASVFGSSSSSLHSGGSSLSSSGSERSSTTALSSTASSSSYSSHPSASSVTSSTASSNGDEISSTQTSQSGSSASSSVSASTASSNSASGTSSEVSGSSTTSDSSSSAPPGSSSHVGSSSYPAGSSSQVSSDSSALPEMTCEYFWIHLQGCGRTDNNLSGVKNRSSMRCGGTQYPGCWQHCCKQNSNSKPPIIVLPPWSFGPTPVPPPKPVPPIVIPVIVCTGKMVQ